MNGCYPYLARRLLTDDRPRIRAALKSFLYGSENSLKVRGPVTASRQGGKA